MSHVIAYIDGYNLYYGLREMHWKWAYWLNLQTLMEHFLYPYQALVKTKYFTTIVKNDSSKRFRQKTFIEALQTLSDFEIFYGHFLSGTVTCSNCQFSYTTHHEKMTDVNIATELLVDAYSDLFDQAFLVSADSDLSAPLKAIRTLFPTKEILVLLPPARSSKQLISLASGHKYISRDVLRKSLFPDPIIKKNGYRLRKPVEWH